MRNCIIPKAIVYLRYYFIGAAFFFRFHVDGMQCKSHCIFCMRKNLTIQAWITGPGSCLTRPYCKFCLIMYAEAMLYILFINKHMLLLYFGRCISSHSIGYKGSCETHSENIFFFFLLGRLTLKRNIFANLYFPYCVRETHEAMEPERKWNDEKKFIH